MVNGDRYIDTTLQTAQNLFPKISEFIILMGTLEEHKLTFTKHDRLAWFEARPVNEESAMYYSLAYDQNLPDFVKFKMEFTGPFL